MPKLLLFGDSVLKGVIYDGRYHLSTARQFPRLREQGWEIANHARMGCCVGQLLRDLIRHLPEMAQDCHVVLGCGGNDCSYDWPALAAAPPPSGQALPQGPFQPRTPPGQFSRLYAQALAQAQAGGARVWSASLVPLEHERYFDWISREGGGENILAWLGEKSLLYRWQEYYDQLVQEEAVRAGLPQIQLRQPFLTDRLDHLLGPDGIHPTPKGHQLIEAQIEAQMLQFI